MKKIMRHVVQCTISPPTVGPSSGPIRAGMITKFIAASSSLLGKVRTMARRPTGIIIAPPRPCSRRAPVIICAFTDRPQSTEAMVKIEMAVKNTRRVPKRSAIQPLSGMPTARPRM